MQGKRRGRETASFKDTSHTILHCLQRSTDLAPVRIFASLMHDEEKRLERLPS